MAASSVLPSLLAASGEPTVPVPFAPFKVDVNTACTAPPLIIKVVETIGINKANVPPLKQFLLAFLAGCYVSIGCMVAISFGKALPSSDLGMQQFAFGAVFPIGFILIVIVGGEVISGNFGIIFPAFLSKKVSRAKLSVNWIFVYIGNFVGCVFFALIFGFGSQIFAYPPYNEAVKLIAVQKCSSSFISLFFSGVACNMLVCVAVYMATSAKSVGSKIIAIWFPIQTFATIGLEHCVSNMFLIPLGMLYGANVSVASFLFYNLLPVTLGNMLGGVVCIGVGYWYIYSRTSYIVAPAAVKSYGSTSIVIDSSKN